MKLNTITTLCGALLGAAALLSLSACSSTTRTSGANYYPYGSSSYSAIYTPPSWAPSNENLSSIRYYFIPDCDAYYDASTQQYFSEGQNGSWGTTTSVPASCSGEDLSTAYTVLLNSNTSSPWLNNSFYVANYPSHSYDAYGNIVLTNNLITDLPSGYSVTPRGFNENTNSVIFSERSSDGSSIVLRDVPMNRISMYMPPESHIYYYGGGYPSR